MPTATHMSAGATATMSPQTLASQPHYITARNLTLANRIYRAYENVSLDFASGRAHAVCAENKKGKSELLLTLAGRMLPSSGICTVAGIDATRLTGIIRLRKIAGLGFFENVNEVQKGLALHSVVSAELGLVGKHSTGDDLDRYIKAWGLDEVADTNIDDLDRFTYDLLGVALGMAGDPKILVVDDIETDLTEHQSQKMIDLLCQLARQTGVTVVCGTTDYDLAVRFDDVACITDDARSQAAAWEGKHADDVRSLNKTGEVA